MLTEDVNQEVIIEKLYERWVTEKTAVELYDLAIAEARRDDEDHHMILRLQKIRAQEHGHEELLEAVLHRFGREPTAAHPAADMARMQASGLLEVCRRPDVTLNNVLQVLLAAELVDNAGWELLEDLADEAGLDERTVREFRTAGRHELEHLHVIKQLLEDAAHEDLVLRESYPED